MCGPCREVGSPSRGVARLLLNYVQDDVDLQGFGHQGLVGTWPCFMGVDVAHLGRRGWGGE